VNPDRLLECFRQFGVRYKEHPGWRSRNHGSLDAHVIMVHDSVTGGMSDERAASFCRQGRSDLAGPLYECLVGKDGIAHLVANGMAWHAGTGNADRLTQARRGQMPLDRELGRPAAGKAGGNKMCHSVSMITYGAGPYTNEQVEATARVIAAYGRAEGWSARFVAGSTIGHGEFSSRKIDPNYDMGRLRSRVHALSTGAG
jgi:N-acetylmuramoyl-L-alanine amidase